MPQLPIERYQAALAAFDKQQTEAIEAHDSRVSAKLALIDAQQAVDELTAAWRDSETALALIRYSLDCSRADVENELRQHTAAGVTVRAIIPY